MRLPDDAIKGRVESLSPASGAVFSLLPPDNATGNFTKIVQRLPVRIAVPAGGRRRSACCARACRSWSASTPSPATRREAGLTSAADAAEAHSDLRHWSSRTAPMLMTDIAASAARRAGGASRRCHSAAPADRLPRHVLRHVHGVPRHPDRVVVAQRYSGRPVGVGRRNSLGADRLSDRRGDRDSAVRLSVARARHPHSVRQSRPPASRWRA